MPKEAEMAENYGNNLQFIDLIKLFLMHVQEKGVKAFPLLNRQPWHEFFYEVKKKYSARFPELNCIGKFDWDAGYPKCRNIIGLSHAMSYICIYDLMRQSMALDTDIFDLYKKTRQEELSCHNLMLRLMYEYALTIPGFFKQ